MREAIPDRAPGVLGEQRAVHRLQGKVAKVEMLEALRLCLGLRLRVDELELVTGDEAQRRVRLWTDTDPIDRRGRVLRAVRLHRDLESDVVKGADETLVELEQGLATSAYDKGGGRATFAWPERSNAFGEPARVLKFSAVGAYANKIGVTEGADSVDTVFLTPRPQVAAAEATEDGGTPAVKALALEGVENLLNCVHGIESDPGDPLRRTPFF